MKLYKAKLGKVYVKNVFKIFNEVSFTDLWSKAKHFSEDEKEYLLKLFPDVEIKEYDVVESGNSF